MQQVDDVLGGYVAGCTWSERASSDTTEARIEDAHPGVDRCHDVGEGRIARVVKVPAQRDYVDRLRNTLDERGDLAGNCDPYGVGKPDLLGSGRSELAGYVDDESGIVTTLEGATKGRSDRYRGLLAGRSGGVAYGGPPLDRLGDRRVLVALREGFGGDDDTGDLVDLGGDCPLYAARIEGEGAIANPIDSGNLGHDGIAVGHLWHRLRVHETGGLDAGVTSSDQPLNERYLLVGGEVGRVGLETVARRYFDDLDMFCHRHRA